jgi:predicted regulator of Ras-like GTPase activity (Roadblock/LC7/MglB family)
MFPSMDANDAVTQLLDVSDEVHTVVVFERGEPVASNLPDEEASEISAVADAMLAYAGALRKGVAVKQLEAVTPDGDVYVAREGERAVVAIAAAGSLAGLVQHDLRTLLGSLRRPRRRATANATA